jgi:hypothetical protein
MAKLTDKLDQIFQKYDERQAEHRKVQQEAKKAEDVFLEDFANFRRDVVKPFFDEIGAYLKQKGHDFRIREQDYSVGEDKKTTDAGITLFIFPAGVEPRGHREYENPHYSVFATRYSKTLRLHGSNMRPGSGGSAGPRGEYKLEQLNRQVLENDLVKHLGDIFPGPRA